VQKQGSEEVFLATRVVCLMVVRCRKGMRVCSSEYILSVRDERFVFPPLNVPDDGLHVYEFPHL
jgi:hypothetical protein